MKKITKEDIVEFRPYDFSDTGDCLKFEFDVVLKDGSTVHLTNRWYIREELDDIVEHLNARAELEDQSSSDYIDFEI